jgi:WD40 repeat protein
MWKALRFMEICTVGALIFATPLRAQTHRPTQEPQLRVEPGMHTARINRVGVDASCSLLATGSYDKTVRLWTLPDGNLIRTLRPPIGPGDDGNIYAVAMAPDGAWIAAGGATFANAHFVYVFQTATGRVITRLGPLAAVVNHLAVSMDGRYLAATLGNGEGLRVWQRTGAGLVDWQLVAQDKNYDGKESYGATFASTGTLYTVAYGGKLRRYVPGYSSEPVSTETRGGQQPYSVAIDPSANRVAVGFRSSKAVEVYDAASLELRFAADTKGVRAPLRSVAWSTDGTRLYAAGQTHSIRVWDRAGEGTAREIKGPTNTIFHLLPCGDGIAVGEADPAFGLIAADGSRRLWREAIQSDTRGKRSEHFTVSPNGLRLRFGLKQGIGDPVLFDLAAEHLRDAPEALPELNAADTSMRVTGREGNYQLNGKSLGNLDTYETVRSIAVAPDKQSVVVGAEYSLNAYDKGGAPIWRQSVPGVAWGVNIAPTNKLIIVAYSDGTIRWHRLDTGAELLALFIQPKDRRWVAWTPKGYYLASPGAENLIGWHVNRSWDEAADFFPVDRFRDQFNRPDIVKLVLDVLDEEVAIAEANKRAGLKRAAETIRTALPPVVEITRPENDATFHQQEVTLEYSARSPTGKAITDIDVRINGSTLGARALIPVGPLGDELIKLTLTLPPHDVTVTLVAREGDRASQPASIRLRWDGAKSGETLLPRLRGLFVGVSDYKVASLKLALAAKDATDLASYFKTQEGKAYRQVETRVLANAGRAEVLDGLDWLEKGSEEGDVNLLFLAGHGVTDEKGYFYFLAADGLPSNMRATAVGRDEILRTIKNRKGAMVVMLDACQSGASIDTSVPTGSPVDMNRLVNELGDKTLGVFLYASALGRQFSYEDAAWGNGAFTKAIIEGLSGKADRENTGFVDTDELALYVRRRVLDMTTHMQEPVRIKPDAAPEMRIARLKP